MAMTAVPFGVEPASRARARVCACACVDPPNADGRLEPLATLVSESDPRRRVLANIDRIAQSALNTVRSYTNKRGDEVVVALPDWNAALRAMVAAAALLDSEFVKAANAIEGKEPTRNGLVRYWDARKGEEQWVSVPVRRIMEGADHQMSLSAGNESHRTADGRRVVAGVNRCSTSVGCGSFPRHAAEDEAEDGAPQCCQNE
jgi:hypothetical protein